MNNPNQHFFQAFFGPQGPQNAQIQQQIPEYINKNIKYEKISARTIK